MCGSVLDIAHLVDKYLELLRCSLLLVYVSFEAHIQSTSLIPRLLDALDLGFCDVPIPVAIPPFNCLTAHCRISS